MKRLALSLATAIVLCPISGWAQDNGAAAFAERDFATANLLWQNAAQNGDAEAMLGLGLLADRGFGQPRDITVAFDWYLQAAQLGLAEAQFNVAIMLDAGLGRPRQAQQAQVWYTRAALRGHARAQYNLGLLFESGDGISANPELAAFWFEKAAIAVPAAADKEFDLQTPVNAVSPPDILFAEVGSELIELVWNADPSANNDYLVEVVRLPDVTANYDAPAISENVAGAGWLHNADPAAKDAIWRVVNITGDASDYAASDWSFTARATAPLGRITLLFDPNIAAMESAAEVFAAGLRDAGYWVQLAPEARSNFEPFFVSFGYASDQTLAQSVASFLPNPGKITPTKQMINAMQPGEIVVNLSAFR